MIARRSASLVTCAAALGALAGAWPTSTAGAQPKASKPRRGLTWGYNVDGGGGYDSNARFQQADGEDDMMRRLHADLALAMVSRTSLTVTGAGDVTSYQTLHDLDHFAYTFGAGLARTMSPRLTTGLGVTASSSLSPAIDIGGVELPLTSLTRTTTRSAAGTMAWRVTPRTNASLDANVRQTTFGSSALSDGTSQALRTVVQRQTMQWFNIGGELQAERTVMNGTTFLTENLVSSWAFARGPLAMRVRAGAVGVQTQGSDERAVRPTAEAELGRTFHRTFVASIRGGRSVAPALGLGQVTQTDHIGASLERQSPYGTTVRLSVDQATSGDPTTAGDSAVSFRIKSTAASVELRRPFPGGIWVGLAGFFRQRDQSGVVAGRGIQLTVGRSRRP